MSESEINIEEKTDIKDFLFNIRNLDRCLDFLDFLSLKPEYKAIIVDSLGNITERIDNYLIKIYKTAETEDEEINDGLH